jgi:hypothetical protein
MNSLESLSNADFTIDTVFKEDCKLIWSMCDERGLKRIKCKYFSLRSDQELERIVEPENRLAYMFPPKYFSFLYGKKFKHGVFSLHEADEKLPPNLVGINSPGSLKEITSLKISQIVESGLYSRFIEDYKSQPKLSDIGPQVLTLQYLEVGFVICCSLYALSFVVFVLECNWKRLERAFAGCYADNIVVGLLTKGSRKWGMKQSKTTV